MLTIFGTDSRKERRDAIFSGVPVYDEVHPNDLASQERLIKDATDYFRNNPEKSVYMCYIPHIGIANWKLANT